MKVSVIVPCYKVERYLPTCIESVLHQTYSDWELILVDDGSPDRSGDICDDYAKKDKRIRVIHKHNGGLSDARNAGLDVMTGDYVTFLDSDDFWHIDYLKILMGFIIQDGADIAQCDFVRGTASSFPMYDNKGRISIYNRHSVFTSQVTKIIMCGKIYKALFFERLRMPVGYINEDDWTTWKLYDQAEKVIVTDQPLYYYTINPNSIMGNARKRPDFTYWEAYKERITYYEGRKEQDLVDISRMQFMKSLVMIYSCTSLRKEERKKVKHMFDQQWKLICKSSFVSNKLKVAFYFFSIFPAICSKVISTIVK